MKKVFAPVTWGVDYILTKKRRMTIKGEKKIDSSCVVLCTHMSVLDYSMVTMLAFPHKVYNVCDRNDFKEHKILRNTRNCIYEYKFAKNPDLLREMKACLKSGNVLAIYPEIKYSVDGTNSELSPNLYKIIKMLQVPVMILKLHGSYINEPCWNKKSNLLLKNNLMEVEMNKLFTKEEVEKMTIEEIKQKITEEFLYNEYEWQRENGVKIKEKDSCKGLEKVLFKCPICDEEYKMISKNDKIYCNSCGKQWKMRKDGRLESVIGETEFIYIPEWFKYQKKKVRDEILSGEYNMFSEIVVERVLENGREEIVDEKGELWHNEEGMMIFFRDTTGEVVIEKSSEDMYACYIDYDYKNKGECIKIYSNSVMYNIYPLSEYFSVTKLALAIEIIYNFTQETKRKMLNKKKKLKEKVVTVDVQEIIENEEKVEKENKDAIIAVEFRSNEYTNEKMEEIKRTAHTVNVEKRKSK